MTTLEKRVQHYRKMLEGSGYRIVGPQPERCPPHNFDAAFVSDEKGGAIYCRYCGLVLPLEVELVEAPAEERIETPADVHPPQ